MSLAVDRMPASPRCHRLLLTGAAGNLGRVLRPRLKAHADVLRVSDVAAMAPAEAGEEVVPCNLADPAAAVSYTHLQRPFKSRPISQRSNGVIL